MDRPVHAAFFGGRARHPDMLKGVVGSIAKHADPTLCLWRSGQVLRVYGQNTFDQRIEDQAMFG